MAKQPKTETDDAPRFEPQRTEDGRTIFEVTEKAPPYIAGKRMNGATEIALTEDQARAELLAGHIWPKGMPRKARHANKADEAAAEAGAEAASS